MNLHNAGPNHAHDETKENISSLSNKIKNVERKEEKCGEKVFHNLLRTKQKSVSTT